MTNIERYNIIETAKGYIGLTGSDRGFMIDWYNSFEKKPRNVKANIKQAWCALFVSYVVGINGLTELREISCGRMIENAKNLGLWVEDDGHTPHTGDIIMYDWQDTKNQGKDNRGWPDHTGIITDVNGNYFTVTEGNFNNRVQNRKVAKKGRYIRGFICLTAKNDADLDIRSVALQVARGLWGNGTARRKKLEAAGYDYQTVQNEVNRIVRKEK